MAQPMYRRGYSFKTDRRFNGVDAVTSAMLLFPGNRIATYTCSFDSADVTTYSVLGTKGKLQLDMAYEYAGEISMQIAIGDRKQKRTYAQRDQFGPELVYFSDCILNDREPEPSGKEGLADIRIIRAIQESARTGRAVRIPQLNKQKRPSKRQEIFRPAVREPPLVNVEAASED